MKKKTKEFLIMGKGYKNIMTDDPYLSGVEVADITTAYGYIEFKGTDKELDKFLMYLYKDESTFKVIGVHNAITNSIL